MRVLVPSAVRSYTGASQVEAAGEPLLALFADLDRRYPGLRHGRWFSADVNWRACRSRNINC